ncbi:hypothetical protein C8R44DRAFT_746639 [Mycena epipterygia]|nr:hypothetical protein C8R44DRAFT_746639 [Mycena epipterygia]
MCHEVTHVIITLCWGWAGDSAGKKMMSNEILTERKRYSATVEREMKPWIKERTGEPKLSEWEHASRLALERSEGVNIGGVGITGGRELYEEQRKPSRSPAIQTLIKNTIPVVVAEFIEAESEALRIMKCKGYERWKQARIKNRDDVGATGNTESVGGGEHT